MLNLLTTAAQMPVPVSEAINLASTFATDSLPKKVTFDLSGLQDNKGGLTIGSTTEVTFKAIENRSTGYQWEITSNSCGAKFALGTDNYNKDSSNSGLMGAGGERVWTYNSLTPDANYMRGVPCDLKFVYKRPWLTTPDSPSDIKTVTVIVN